MGKSDDRNFERFPLARLAFVQSTNTGETYGGVLKNISAAGALIALTFPMETVSDSFSNGRSVDVTIDEFPPINGLVLRAALDSVALSFMLNSDHQNDLMDEIMEAMENEPGQPTI